MHSNLAPWLWFIVAALYAMRAFAALATGQDASGNTVTMLTALVLMKLYEEDE